MNGHPLDTPLTRAIRAAGLTQRELANRIGVDESLVSRYVRGLDPGKRREVIASTLGRDASELWPPTGVAA